MIAESTEQIVRRHDTVLRRHSMEFTKVHDTLSRLESLALKHGEQLTSLQADMIVVKQDIAELKADVAELKAEVAELKADVAELKADVAELKTDMREVKASLGEILRRLPPAA